MAFYNTTTLVQKVITRLRQVAGAGTQLYSEDIILDHLIETYEICRGERWWDHLTQWYTRELTGTDGKITVPLVGARERFRDIHRIKFATNNVDLPMLTHDINPARLTGTEPRYVEPLAFSDDSTGTYLFRIYPLTATTTSDRQLQIRARLDPTGVFDDPSVVVPFDATCLINGAAMRYMADDAANASGLAVVQAVYNQRMAQLQQQHDATVISLDPRMANPNIQSEWMEEP
jgi:hypothetical protein